MLCCHPSLILSAYCIFPAVSLLRHLFSSLSFSSSTDGTIAYSSESRSLRWDHFFHLYCLQPNPSHHHLISVCSSLPADWSPCFHSVLLLTARVIHLGSTKKLILTFSSFLFSSFIVYTGRLTSYIFSQNFYFETF